MAVVAHVVLPGVAKEQYDQVRELVGWLGKPPAGGISHLTWWEGGDCHNMDSRESEQAFNQFGEQRLGPGMAKVGVQVQPPEQTRTAATRAANAAHRPQVRGEEAARGTRRAIHVR
jgi:hypothetical protein